MEAERKKKKLCPHQRQKFLCKDCGGAGICERQGFEYVTHLGWALRPLPKSGVALAQKRAQAHLVHHPSADAAGAAPKEPDNPGKRALQRPAKSPARPAGAPGSPAPVEAARKILRFFRRRRGSGVRGVGVGGGGLATRRSGGAKEIVIPRRVYPEGSCLSQVQAVLERSFTSPVQAFVFFEQVPRPGDARVFLIAAHLPRTGDTHPFLAPIHRSSYLAFVLVERKTHDTELMCRVEIVLMIYVLSCYNDSD